MKPSWVALHCRRELSHGMRRAHLSGSIFIAVAGPMAPPFLLLEVHVKALHDLAALIVVIAFLVWLGGWMAAVWSYAV